MFVTLVGWQQALVQPLHGLSQSVTDIASTDLSPPPSPLCFHVLTPTVLPSLPAFCQRRWPLFLVLPAPSGWWRASC